MSHFSDNIIAACSSNVVNGDAWPVVLGPEVPVSSRVSEVSSFGGSVHTDSARRFSPIATGDEAKLRRGCLSPVQTVLLLPSILMPELMPIWIGRVRPRSSVSPPACFRAAMMTAAIWLIWVARPR